MTDLQDALNHHLVVSEITKTATPDMPYVTIMGPTVADVELVVKAARLVANPPPEALKVLDGHPDLYEFSSREVKALVNLGVQMIPVKNEYIVQNVLDGLAALTRGDTK